MDPNDLVWSVPSSGDPNDITWAAAIEQAEKRTRRERIATAVLQGMLAGAVETDGLPAAFDLNLAAWAVKHADALIAELDKSR